MNPQSISVSAGNARVSKVPKVQRGQWKNSMVTRDITKGRDPVDPKLGRRKQESRYWCLINLNKAAAHDDEATLEAMRDTLHWIVDKMQHDFRVWMQIFEFGEGQRQPAKVAQEFRKDRLKLFNPATVRQVIEHIKVDNFVVERGPKRGRVHCHFKFEVDHWSQLRLNFKEIPNVIMRLWNSRVSGSFPDETQSRMQFGLSKKGTQTRPLFWAKLLHERNFEMVSDAYNMKDAIRPTMPPSSTKKKAPDWASTVASQYGHTHNRDEVTQQS